VLPQWRVRERVVARSESGAGPTGVCCPCCRRSSRSQLEWLLVVPVCMEGGHDVRKERAAP
jgi:hypothetical protein